MNKEVLELIVCPECKGNDFSIKEVSKEDSILLCRVCRNWYLNEEGILELLSEKINESRKSSFFRKHEKKLRAMKMKAPEKSVEEGKSIEQKKSQMKFFNEFSSEYVLETQHFWKAYYNLFFKRIMQKITKGSRILDIGCGTGLGSAPFLNNEYKVIGIDISREMIKKAQKRVAPEFKQRHYFFVADAENLPFKKEIFDAEIGMGVLHHVGDIQKMADASMHCLKKNGSYFGHENNKTMLRPIFDALMKVYSLWHEEAGEEQLLSKRDIRRIFKGCTIRATTNVFLPPHGLNWLSEKRAKRVLEITDKIAAKIPGIKNNGGTIIFEVQKGA